ncbi:hypothetical protein ACA910_016379 [Epithemia clementina (nom. ined.)]
MDNAFLDKIVVVTGGGSGIGKALCQAFHDAGATVVVVDLRGSQQVVDSMVMARQSTNSPKQGHLLAFTCDVSDRHQIEQMIRQVKKNHGRVDIYCSNAGIFLPHNNNETKYDNPVAMFSEEQWSKIFRVNVQSHVIAIRELLPDWEQGLGDGHFLITASAAGLLTLSGDASYGVTKAAAVSLAEHVAIAHYPTVKVHCLCPQAVETPFIRQLRNSPFHKSAMTDGIISPDIVAECSLDAIRRGDFWIFPHPRVQEYMKRKVMDHARWLKGMQSLHDKLSKQSTTSKL